MTTPAAAARTGGKTQQGRTPAPGQHMPGSFRPPARTKPATQSAAATTKPATKKPAAKQKKPPAPKPYRPKQPKQAYKAQRRQVAQHAGRAARAPGGSMTDYQKVIAAEFVIAELLIAATPMTSQKNPTDASPYVPRDMTKMLAVGAVYFLLELLAIPSSWGRLMAWLGGLVLLTVGLNEGANVARDIDAFAGIKTAVAKARGGGETASA